ncbi:MAG: hypothetical protein R2939_03355 [Kofleriaceae bacterium]
MLVAEVPAAVPVSEAHRERLAFGAFPALGAYWRLGPSLAGGLRLRAGAIAADARDLGPGMLTPTSAGLLAPSLAVRLQRATAWVEVVGGPGLTGGDLVPVFEIGVGLTFGDRIQFGPALRAMRVVGGAPTMVDPGTADLALLGLELRLRPATRPRAARIATAPPVTPARVEEPAPPVTPARVEEPASPSEPTERPTDAAEVVEALGGCVGPTAACEDAEVTAVGNRVIFSATVLFDTNRARVRSRARPALAQLAALLRERGERCGCGSRATRTSAATRPTTCG